MDPDKIHNFLFTEIYSKCYKILNTFLFLFANKMLVFRIWILNIHKKLVRIANRKDPDQTAPSEAVRSGSVLFVKAFMAGN